MDFYDHFEIDMIEALASQLISAFEKLSIGMLSIDVIESVPKIQGVYQLFKIDRLVYMGKAANLPKRLTEHHSKISGRNNISVRDIGFKCLSVHPNWTTLAPEETLIKHYKSHDSEDCEWNGNIRVNELIGVLSFPPWNHVHGFWTCVRCVLPELEYPPSNNID